MSRLDREPQVRELAKRLGLGRTASPVEAILSHCQQRIDRWVAEAGNVTTIGQLERLVTQRLQMVFEEIHSEEDFDRLKVTYAKGKKELAFAALRVPFDDAKNPSYGVLI
jgi:hypothetical protein